MQALKHTGMLTDVMFAGSTPSLRKRDGLAPIKIDPKLAKRLEELRLRQRERAAKRAQRKRARVCVRGFMHASFGMI
jgi:hypothetical protein